MRCALLRICSLLFDFVSLILLVCTQAQTLQAERVASSWRPFVCVMVIINCSCLLEHLSCCRHRTTSLCCLLTSMHSVLWQAVPFLQAASDRQAFNAEDFPSVSGGPGAAGVMSGGRWAAAGGAIGGRINAEDFPALPGWSSSQCMTAQQNLYICGTHARPVGWSCIMHPQECWLYRLHYEVGRFCLFCAGITKSAKRRAKEKNKSLAQRVGTQGQVRVVNRGQPSSSQTAATPQPATASRLAITIASANLMHCGSPVEACTQARACLLLTRLSPTVCCNLPVLLGILCCMVMPSANAGSFLVMKQLRCQQQKRRLQTRHTVQMSRLKSPLPLMPLPLPPCHQVHLFPCY